MTHLLQAARQKYIPALPRLLSDLSQVGFSKSPLSKNKNIHALFPLTGEQPLLVGGKGPSRAPKPLQIGVCFSGGQAAGGHNVIAGLFDALKKLHPGSRLFGFLGGPGGIIAGKAKELGPETITPYRNQGGFDMVGSGRTKIETQEQLASALSVMNSMKLDGLVIIGGDDSNTNAAVLAEYFLRSGCPTKVIGVPKTIDGDLKNSYVATSFGFDTACKTYAEMIGNIARDASSARKYYHFIKLMGRSASHIALECALATHPNLTLIGEEVFQQKKTLSQITHDIADLVVKRAEAGKHFGVVLIPEGLIEFIPEVSVLIKELNKVLAAQKDVSLDKLTPVSRACFSSLPEKIQQQLLLARDPHGNVQVSLIETEQLLIQTVHGELVRRQKADKFSPVNHFLGYEGRSGYPSNFDCNYCYALGHAAALLVDEGASGCMAFISNLTKSPEHWGVGGVPITALMQMEMRKGVEKPVVQKALVDLQGKPFAHFTSSRECWKTDDDYCYPGPIQFFGDQALTDTYPLTLQLE